MRRLAPAALLLLAACSKPSERKQMQVLDVVPATSAAAHAPSAPRPGERLTGQVSALSGDTSALNVRITDTSRIIELPADTLFAFDKADLATGAETNLRKAIGYISEAPPGDIHVVGHTDAKGEDAYNLDLSRRRAETVAGWFRQQPGIRRRLFVVEGRGEADPVAPNARPDGSDDPDGRARNRRVELVVPR